MNINELQVLSYFLNYDSAGFGTQKDLSSYINAEFGKGNNLIGWKIEKGNKCFSKTKNKFVQSLHLYNMNKEEIEEFFFKTPSFVSIFFSETFVCLIEYVEFLN